MTSASMTKPASAVNMGLILRDAALTTLVAAILAIPFVLLQTYDTQGALAVRTRWGLFAGTIGFVFVGRVLLGIYWSLRGPAKSKAKQETPESVERTLRMTRFIGIALLILAVAMPMLPGSDRQILNWGIDVLIYVMLGWGLNIVVGLAGLLDLGYVAFYAVGAYTYAIAATELGWNFWLCLPLAGVFAAFFGIILGFPTLRLRGDYLAIVTLGFGEIIRIVLINWKDAFGGPAGIGNIPKADFFGHEFARSSSNGNPTFHELFGIEFSSDHRFIYLYYLILVLALGTNWLVNRLRKLPVGRAWEALREDEIACKSLGMNPTNTKLSAFAIGAMLGGFAGSFFALKQSFISPESFTFIESATILAIVVLGGLGSQIGVVAAALVLVMLPELARELNIADIQQLRMVAFGLAMILIMIWRPQGLISHREPTVRLNAKETK